MADDLVDDLEGKPKPAGEGDKPPAAGKGAPPKGAKKPPPKNAIIIILSLAGVVIAWMTFKKPSTASTASTTGASSATVPSVDTGTVAGATDPNAGAGFASMLNNISGQLTQLQASTPATTTATTPTSGSSGTVAPAFDYAGASSDSYIRNNATGEIDQVNSSGSIFHINPQQWAIVQAAGGGTHLVGYGSAPTPAPPPAKAAPKPPYVAPKK